MNDMITIFLIIFDEWKAISKGATIQAMNC